MKINLIFTELLMLACLLSSCYSGSASNTSTTSNNESSSDVIYNSGACSIFANFSSNTEHAVFNPLVPRQQWNANDGYCGGNALIIAGLYYGQYVSQYDARAIASGEPNQTIQVLIGIYGDNSETNNIIAGAKNMHLDYNEYDNYDFFSAPSNYFLTWIKTQVIKKYPVAIGVFENSSIFYNIVGFPPDSAYDHIVTIFGINSNHNINESPVNYYNDDVIYLHDNGLFKSLDHHGLSNIQYSKNDCYSYNMRDFQKSRTDANKITSYIYTLNNNSNQQGNYGVAFTGVRTTNSELAKTSIQTNPLDELPAIAHGSSVRPKPSPVTLTITIKDLKANTDYILYKYNNFSNMPKDDDFSGTDVGKVQKKCLVPRSTVDNGTFITHESIMSDEIAIYRTVKKTDANTKNTCGNKL